MMPHVLRCAIFAGQTRFYGSAGCVLGRLALPREPCARVGLIVASVTAGKKPSTLIGQVLALLAVLNRPRDGQKVKAFAVKAVAAAREHVTTVVAFASIDLGCFRASAVAGWIVLGVSLLIIEWKIRG